MLAGRMRRAWRRQLAVVLLASCVASASCSVDERDLRVDTAAASRGGAGAGGDGAPSGAGPSARGGDGSGGRTEANAGSSGDVGGSGAASDVSGAGQNEGGAPKSGGGASTLGGGGNTAGSLEAASAGALFVGPCGDIDDDKVDDCLETLAQNGGFDRDLSGWTPSVGSEAAWDSRDARMEAASGSMLVSNLAPTESAPGEVMVAAEQCLPVAGGSSYVLAARVLIPSAQGLGEGGINIWTFDGSNCQGTFLIAATPGQALAAGVWTVVQGEVTMPPTAKSMLLRMAVSRPFQQSRLDVLFDDVLVKAK